MAYIQITPSDEQSTFQNKDMVPVSTLMIGDYITVDIVAPDDFDCIVPPDDSDDIVAPDDFDDISKPSVVVMIDRIEHYKDFLILYFDGEDDDTIYSTITVMDNTFTLKYIMPSDICMEG